MIISMHYLRLIAGAVVLLCLSVLPGFAAESVSKAGVQIGPLLPQPVVSFYVVVDGDQPVDARVVIRRGSRQEADRVLVRAFDPDENVTFWQYSEPGNMRDTLGPGDMEVWGIPLQIPDKPAAGDLLMDSQMILRGKGVHQIRIVSGARNCTATLELSRPVGWGVSCQNGNFTQFENKLTSMYAFVPPHAEALEIVGGPFTIADESGKNLASMASALNAKSTVIPVAKTSVLWKFDFGSAEPWKFRAAGFPLILCPTPDAAREIHASVETLADGTVVCHKFQKTIAEILPALLTPERIGKADDLVVPMSKYREQWLADPVRNLPLIEQYGMFSSIEPALRNQNVDPKSHWSGALGGDQAEWVKKADGAAEGGWQSRINKQAPENRWDRLKSVDGLWAGVSPRSAGAENMAQAVFLKAPFNPYYGKKELLYRAAAAALRDLMALGEDENWRGVGADMTDYPGMMAFPVAQKTFPVYELVAPHMPADVQAVWTQALRHIVDRMYPEQLVTCRNQSTHFLVAFEAYAKGSGDKRYQDLSRAFAKRFAAGTHPAGFQIEQMGPDASYIGMSNWHMAVYYRMSQDPVILETIRKAYSFFNHTVAPEPDGRMLGGFNFGHRIADGFNNEQWGGAKGILDDLLPEVGLWAKAAATDDQKEKAAQQISKILSKPLPTTMSNITTPHYLYAREPNRTGTWPALEKNSYIRTFASEMVAVKRPGYYTVIYVGKPSPSNHYVAPRENFRVPAASDPDNMGGEAQHRKVTPFLGGGLSLFWTPGYGSALLGTNWSPMARHGLLAVQSDGKRYWEDYFATQYKLNDKAGELTITGRIEGQPINYERTYQFRDQEMIITLKLTPTKACTMQKLAELMPIPTGTVKANGATIVVAGEANNAAKADRIAVQDKSGKGVEIQFDGAQDITLQRNGMQRRGMQISRAEIALPTNWQAGQSVTLKYAVRGIEKK